MTDLDTLLAPIRERGTTTEIDGPVTYAEDDRARLLAAIDAVTALIEHPFASADMSHYDDDFNRGHVAGYNAAAHLLRAALTEALGKEQK